MRTRSLSEFVEIRAPVSHRDGKTDFVSNSRRTEALNYFKDIHYDLPVMDND